MEKVENKIEKLTVSQALEQGYTQCGYDNTDFQHLMQIKDLCADDFERSNNIILVADTKENYVAIDKQDIMDLLLDRYADESPDDDNYDINSCFEEQSEKIEAFVYAMNEVYAKKPWYYLCHSIQLIPDESPEV